MVGTSGEQIKNTTGFFVIFSFLKSVIFLLIHSVAKAFKAIMRVFEVDCLNMLSLKIGNPKYF